MRAAARRGLRRRLRSEPPEQDVEDAVVHAFNELWRMERSTLNSPINMGCSIAFRRGFDRGRRIARERQDAHRVAEELSLVAHGDVAVDNESDHEAIMVIVRRCQEDLTADQKEVIDATIEGTRDGRVSLSDFAERRGTTYEACRRMRDRGMRALARCLEAAGVRGAS